MANQTQAGGRQRVKEPKFLLGSLFVDAPVVAEPEEKKKIVVAGMAEATIRKEYPEGFVKKAAAVCRGEYKTLVRASLWFLLAALVFVLVLLVAEPFFESYVIGSGFVFTGGLGVGFNPTGEVDSIAEQTARLYWEVYEPLLLMLAGAGIIATPFLSGLFYCAKRSYYQDVYKRTTATFFMGFAKYWWKFLVAGTVGILIATAMGTSLLYQLSVQAVGGNMAGSLAAVILTFIFGVPLLMVPMVMMSLFTTYELSFGDAFKNALVIIFNNPVYVIAASVVSVAPLLLLLVSQVVSIIVVVVMFLIGFIFWALAWVGVADRGMTKCKAYKAYFDKKKAVAQGRAAKAAGKSAKATAIVSRDSVTEQGAAPAPAPKKKAAPAPYQNPKKKKKKK